MSKQSGWRRDRKLWLVVGLVATLLGTITACGTSPATPQAAAVATRRPTVTPRTPRTSDSAVLGELNFGSGGGGIPTLCRDGDFGPLPASGELIIGVGDWGDDHYYGNGETIIYENAGYTDYTNNDYTGIGWLALPHICVDDPAYAADVEVIGPSGDVYPPVIPMESFEEPGAILLPPDAYMWGGTWEVTLNNLGQFPELGMDTFTVTFDIQPTPSPIQVGVTPDGRLVAVGFDANEPIVALLTTSTGEVLDQINLEADESGTVAFDKGGREVKYILVGFDGPSHVVLGEGVYAPEEAARESLYLSIWGE